MGDLDELLVEYMSDPEFAAAYDAESARLDRMIDRPCSEGCCTEFYDPETGETEAGWGPVGCACQDETR